MFGENASLLKSIEIDDSLFQCDPDCAAKYLLLLEWSPDNEARQWKVMERSQAINSRSGKTVAATNSNDSSEEIEALQETIKWLQETINELNNRIVSLEVEKENEEIEESDKEEE